jgi:hypothetical protein
VTHQIGQRKTRIRRGGDVIEQVDGVCRRLDTTTGEAHIGDAHDARADESHSWPRFLRGHFFLSASRAVIRLSMKAMTSVLTHPLALPSLSIFSGRGNTPRATASSN